MSRTPPLPQYRIVTSKLMGAPYSVSALYVGQTLIYSCLGVIDNPEERVRNYVAPEPPREPNTEFSYYPQNGNRRRGTRYEEGNE